MKTIGLLGGMSWESTVPYYRLINEAVKQRLGGLHSARLLLHSVDFAEIEALQRSGDWEAAGRQLASAARGLETAGADLLLIGANTMHRVAPAVEAAIGIPLLHVGDATARAVRAADIARVGLLGTRFTMEQAFYVDRLAAHGLDVLVPPPAEREEVHRVIYQELCAGRFEPSSRARFRQVMAGLVSRGAQGVILGCTEIGLLVDADDASVPLFDTTRLHALAAVEAALGG
ncbi:aspartate/glutamate racemase family protein [Dyella ginsengisoli]|uniref:aspartate/glutamate racemase family protein n=1 Tax=Dyella ginsengisoli TaxID=363848 RepID=UPI00034A66BB|nr:aspartate/glutamate racemase family protein [Dyella ginsengisoli]